MQSSFMTRSLRRYGRLLVAPLAVCAFILPTATAAAAQPAAPAQHQADQAAPDDAVIWYRKSDPPPVVPLDVVFWLR